MNNFLNMLRAQTQNGLSLFRIVTGIIIFMAGYQKVFVWGFPSVQSSFEKMGILLPQVSGPFIGLLELIGGVLLVLGVFTRQLATIYFIEFIVATWVVWGGRGFAGARLEIMLLFAFVLLATNGAGALSVDRMLLKKD
ncbi:MAG: DoxX family protein [Candidatus Lambdaproteobacteria bacterium]|nr:DoxX family protein [Candidatus Lambdaproteobacteria bacterium]